MENLLDLIKDIDNILKWKFLSCGLFVILAFSSLSYIPFLNDILGGMKNYLIICCIFLVLLIVFKLLCEFYENRKAKHLQAKQEKEKFADFLRLSKKEKALMKYIFTRPTKSAWLPCNMSEALLLAKKDYIEVLQRGRKNMDMLNFHINQNDVLYTITQDTLNFMNRHKSDVIQKFNKVHYDSALNKYQV